MKQGQVEPNPTLYHQMSEPFASHQQANEAIAAFYADVKAARERHRIPDVLLVIGIVVHATDETSGPAMTTLQFGDSSQEETLAAFAYGQARARREATVAKLLAGKVER